MYLVMCIFNVYIKEFCKFYNLLDLYGKNYEDCY